MSWIGNIIKKVFKNEGLKQPEPEPKSRISNLSNILV